MESRKVFYDFKAGQLVYIRIDNGDGGLGIVVEDLIYQEMECFYLVYSMRENKIVPMFPYELELVARD